MSESERVRYRAQKLGFWIKRLKDLKMEEKEFKAALHEDVARVLADKNLLDVVGYGSYRHGCFRRVFWRYRLDR